MSLFSGIVKALVGVGEIAAGALITVGTLGGGAFLGAALIASGAGMVLSGVGSLILGNPVQGFATATRNPIAPWRGIYGRARVGGNVVYMHTWGDQDQMLDLVVVLAAHACESVDEVLFDQQRVQIDQTAVPIYIGQKGGGPAQMQGSLWAPNIDGTPVSGPLKVAPGSGTSFTPVQQNVRISSIARDINGIVTVVIGADIPYLQAGDQIQIQNVTGDLTLNGVFPVADILSRIPGVPGGAPGALSFTYLSGGPQTLVNYEGQALTKWPDYGRSVYVEFLYGDQLLGDTFIGMQVGTPWQGTAGLVDPRWPGNAGAADVTEAQPWTNYCSLQGKTAAFIRLRYDHSGPGGASKYFPSGLPQISFLVRGKNDVYDPRLGPATGAGTVGLETAGAGYAPRDVLILATGATIAVTATNAAGAITSFVLTSPGTGNTLGASLAASGGHGNGAVFIVQSLAGSQGTTGYTENAALCIADFLAHQQWGFKAAYGTEIPLSQLIAAASVCDEAVPIVAGGTEPRWACNGQFELTMRRGEILQNLLTSCAGRLLYMAGQYVIQAAGWPASFEQQDGSNSSAPPSINLTAIAAGPFRWRPKCSIRDLFNGVKGTYISPENKWQSCDFPRYAQDYDHGYNGPAQYYGDINLEADAAGGAAPDRRWLDLNLPFTISSGQAQRTVKIELLRRRHSGTGTFDLNLAAYWLAPLDIFSGTVPYLGFANKLLEVAAARVKSDDHTANGSGVTLSVEIDVQETDSSIYQWSIEEELSPQGWVQAHFPQGNVQEYAPWPWSPGYAMPLSGDAYYPEPLSPASFGIQPDYNVDGQGNSTIALNIKGTPPINAVDSQVASPQISAVGQATGGSLPPGDYVVGVSAFDASNLQAGYKNTDYLTLLTVTVPAPPVTSSSIPSSRFSLTAFAPNGSQRTGSYFVGDHWVVAISAPDLPNQPVSVTGGKNGTVNTADYGSTDANGNYLLKGSWQLGDIGSWQEAWMVGGVQVATLSFSIEGSGGNEGTGSIQVSITFGSGDDGGEAYLAKYDPSGEFVFHYNQTVQPGASSATLT
ncbi:MAG: hypothetical protein KGL39_51085, partial [Patescibacteria group bacterium]|nr:hypothetical protein [Patescibacteria group bacterium]